MSDLGTRLREHLDEVAPPLDTERLIDQFFGADRYRRRLRPMVAMTAAALLTLLVIGAAGLIVLGGNGEPDVIDPLPPTSVATTLPGTAVTITTVIPPSGAWTPILSTTQAKPAPPAATCEHSWSGSSRAP